MTRVRVADSGAMFFAAFWALTLPWPRWATALLLLVLRPRVATDELRWRRRWPPPLRMLLTECDPPPLKSVPPEKKLLPVKCGLEPPTLPLRPTVTPPMLMPPPPPPPVIPPTPPADAAHGSHRLRHRKCRRHAADATADPATLPPIPPTAPPMPPTAPPMPPTVADADRDAASSAGETWCRGRATECGGQAQRGNSCANDGTKFGGFLA